MRLRALIEHRNAVGDDANARHAKGAQENNGQGEDVVEVGGEERGGDLSRYNREPRSKEHHSHGDPFDKFRHLESYL